MIDKIGIHFSKTVYYIELEKHYSEPLPIDNWVCFAISNHDFDIYQFETFSKNAISNGLLEFKAQGTMGESLHHQFDEIMVRLEINEGKPFINICTTGDNDSDLANAFWECFYASTIPEDADWENINIVCVSVDGMDYKQELESLKVKFETGWIPDE